VITEKDKFINRELSWLEFNQRVLDEAMNTRVPLLERLKFLSITASNLDEFFMVRVGGLQIMVREGIKQTDPTGLSPEKQLAVISNRLRQIIKSQYSCYRRSLEPKLAANGIRFLSEDKLTAEQQASLKQLFNHELSAVVSPMAIAPDTPFPLLTNLGINLIIRLKAQKTDRPRFRYAIVPISPNMERFIRLPVECGDSFFLVEDCLKMFIQAFFPGEEIFETVAFRLSRNADMRIQEDFAPDLMTGMEDILRQRKISESVRLEIGSNVSPTTLKFLKRMINISDIYIYKIPGPLDLSAFMELAFLDGYDALKDPAWRPQPSPEIDLKTSMMKQIAQRDFLLCHPYESYEPVVKLIEEAANDPDVLAIKQILYRTSKKSPIIAALKRAAQVGKYVTVIVELKARFDEARNIEWAKELELAGVQVIYGVKNLKTHAKVCLIVRREPQGIVRYMHFGTGNYNEKTAKIYSDISYFTCKDEYGADASAFINAVTGHSQPGRFYKLAAAPIDMRDRFLELIEGEIARRKQGQKALIMAKMNSLVDPAIIKALYRASAAGVKIMLNIRGVCCLRPGVPHLSKHITATSIIGRYLEHSRVYYFYHGGEELLFISSADWMPRNLDRRIELLVPIQDPVSHAKLLRILKLYFKDTAKSRRLLDDGSYEKPRPTGKNAVSSQAKLYTMACDAVDAAEQMKRTEFQPYKKEIHDGE